MISTWYCIYLCPPPDPGFTSWWVSNILRAHQVGQSVGKVRFRSVQEQNLRTPSRTSRSVQPICWTLKKPHEMNAKILISHIFKNVSPATTHAKSTGSYQSFQYPPIWSSLQVCLASLLALRLPPPLETTVIDSTGWRFDAFNVHIWLTTRKSDLEETRRSSKVRACLK